MKIFAVISAMSGFVTVALGAFGSHGLKGQVSEYYLQVWQTAVQYQMFHSLAVLIVAMVGLAGVENNWLKAGAGCFLVGVLAFSGSLYALVLSGLGWLGAITPIGGVLFLAGWVLLVIGLLKTKLMAQS